MRILAAIALVMGLCLGRAVAAPNPVIAGYHGGGDRSGHYIVPGLTWTVAPTAHRVRSFDGRVQGHIYAQPLYWLPPGAAHGMLIVATDGNVVQAIDANTGAAVWSRTLGRVVPRSALPCGNINPLGVTGTPVLDAAKGALYLDAFVTTKNGGPQHLIFGLSMADGSLLPGWPVNVADELAQRGLSFTPTFQNQRGGLTLVRGRLYVPFGGNWGDCDAYHGWVVGLDGLDSPHPRVFGAWATRAQKGGIWAQGALAFDGASLFAATGNTSGAATWGDGEAILRVPPTLQHSTSTQDYFTPTDWQTLDDDDADLGGTGPLPLDVPQSGGGTQALVLALGKDGNAYLLDRANLGGLGGALLVQPVASSVIITGPAVWRTATASMVAFHATGSACPAGETGGNLVAIAITAGTPPGLATAWCAAFNGGGAPIVTTSNGTGDPVVWIVGGEGDQALHGFRGDTGQVLFAGGGAADLAPGVRHLSTLIAAEGRLYVAGDGRVFAYAFTPALP